MQKKRARQEEETDCSCGDPLNLFEGQAADEINRTAYINRLTFRPITSVTRLTQTTPSQEFCFRTPLRNVRSARIEMVWARGFVNPEPMVALYCPELSQYQRGNNSGINIYGTSEVNKSTVVWLQPTVTITDPINQFILQNPSYEMYFDVIKDFVSLNFRLDSYPVSGQLTFGQDITWNLITKHENSG